MYDSDNIRLIVLEKKHLLICFFRY